MSQPDNWTRQHAYLNWPRKLPASTRNKKDVLQIVRKAIKFGDPNQRDRSIAFKKGFDPTAYSTKEWLKRLSRKPGDKGPKPCCPKCVWNVLQANSKAQPAKVSGGVVCNHTSLTSSNVNIWTSLWCSYFLFCHTPMPLALPHALLSSKRSPSCGGRPARSRRCATYTKRTTRAMQQPWRCRSSDAFCTTYSVSGTIEGHDRPYRSFHAFS